MLQSLSGPGGGCVAFCFTSAGTQPSVLNSSTAQSLMPLWSLDCVVG